MVEKEVPTLALIERMSRFNAFARTVGLFIAAFVTLLLVKNLLRPYRLMMKKAAKEKIIPTSEKNKRDGEMDIAVEIFEKVIRELRQKEKVLKELYQKTDRKAKDLASYNQYILKSMTSGMIITDEEGKIRQINHPAERILNLLQNQVLDKHYKDVFGEESPLYPAIQTTFIEQRTYFVPEIKLINPNGESIFLSLSSSAVKDEQDKMLGAVVFLTDLTEIKKLEEEIGFKDKMAALGEMSSGLAHELRNSMGAVLGFSKLLTKGRDDSTSQSQAIDGIVREAMIMESMLQRFLAFAKPFQLKIEDIDLKEIIQKCHSSARETLKEKKITFELESKTDLPLIPGDRILLKQCFQNLIQNSIEAMPHGGELRIRLREEQLHTQEKCILVEVSDSGCGIAKADQDKIFNPFFTSREKGTGLGLSLVKKIISLHNGRIELESEPDRGTTFRIHLPLKPEVKPTLTGSEQKDELEPVIFSHPINVEEGNKFEPEM
jgi:PAS domain S-box-containing protein